MFKFQKIILIKDHSLFSCNVIYLRGVKRSKLLCYYCFISLGMVYDIVNIPVVSEKNISYSFSLKFIMVKF
jgi:hypothetical protein